MRTPHRPARYNSRSITGTAILLERCLSSIHQRSMSSGCALHLLIPIHECGPSIASCGFLERFWDVQRCRVEEHKTILALDGYDCVMRRYQNAADKEPTTEKLRWIPGICQLLPQFFCVCIALAGLEFNTIVDRPYCFVLAWYGVLREKAIVPLPFQRPHSRRNLDTGPVISDDFCCQPVPLDRNREFLNFRHSVHLLRSFVPWLFAAGFHTRSYSLCL